MRTLLLVATAVLVTLYGCAGGASIGTGDRAVLSYADGESFVWLSVDEATRKALHKAVAADDKIGVLELEHIGKLHRFQSADRTPVLVLEPIWYGYKVRILGGDKLGLVGLVPTEGVQPQ